MKSLCQSLLLVLLLVPTVSWAGARLLSTIPTLGETGLVSLAMALMATGLVVLRRKRR